jgi:hypothetical protein
MFVTIKESKLPTPKSKAWTLQLTSGNEVMPDECLVGIFGASGSLKARFTVSLNDLKEKVDALERGDV